MRFIPRLGVLNVRQTLVGSAIGAPADARRHTSLNRLTHPDRRLKVKTGERFRNDGRSRFSFAAAPCLPSRHAAAERGREGARLPGLEDRFFSL